MAHHMIGTDCTQQELMILLGFPVHMTSCNSLPTGHTWRMAWISSIGADLAGAAHIYICSLHKVELFKILPPPCSKNYVKMSSNWEVEFEWSPVLTTPTSLVLRVI